MGNKTEFRVEGGKEIAALLKDLPHEFQKKGMMHAFRAGARVIMGQIKLNAKAAGLPDRIVSDIRIMRPRFQAAGQVLLIRFRNKGAADGRRNTLTTPALAAVFEFGTNERFRNSRRSRKGKKGDHGGGSTGRIVARPFYRKALDSRTADAVKAITTLTHENLTIISKQLAAKHKVSLAKKNRNI